MDQEKDPLLSLWIKRLGLFTAVAYVFGFLIETVYLGAQGFFIPDLVRAQYVFSGVVFIGYAGSIVLISFYFTKDLATWFRNRDAKYSLLELPLSFLLAGIAAVFAAGVGASMLGVLGLLGGRYSELPSGASFAELPGKLLELMSGWSWVIKVMPGTLTLVALVLFEEKLDAKLSASGVSTFRKLAALLKKGNAVIRLVAFIGIMPVVLLEGRLLAKGIPEIGNALLSNRTGSTKLLASGVFYPAFGLGLSTAIMPALIGLHLRRSSTAETGKRRVILWGELVALGSWYAVGLLALIIGLLGSYATIVHPMVSRSAGGGAPEVVELLVKNDSLNKLLHSPGTEVLLLHQTDKYYLLQMRRGKQIIERLYVPAETVEYYRVLTK